LAIPVRVIELLGDDWVAADVGGVVSRVSVALLSDVSVGDYLIVHAGLAITRLNVDEAASILALFDEIAAHLREAPHALPTQIS